MADMSPSQASSSPSPSSSQSDESLHTLRAFDTELTALDAMLAEMGQRVAANLEDALVALEDHGHGADVTAADAEVDALDARINEQVVRLLALRQPMANDLRSIVAGLRCSAMLERAGDYAVGIARRGLAVRTPAPGRSAASVRRMGRMVSDLMARGVAAYMNRDTEAARAVWEADAEIDAVHASLFRELLTYMMEDPRDIGRCTQLLFAAKNLERIGDQATNIAELAVYRVTGETLGHARPKDDAASFTGLDGNGLSSDSFGADEGRRFPVV